MTWSSLQRWYSDFPFKAFFWTAIVTIFVLGGLSLFGVSAIVNAFSDEITVKIDNNCITEKGLVRSNAGSRCYEDGLPHPHPPSATMTTASNTTTAPAPAPKAALVYDPPCGPGSNAHACTEQITKKSRVSGRIHTVTFHGGGSADSNEDHIVPDYTAVEYDPCDGDDCDYETVEFCGNLLDSFEPGKMLNMVLKDSNLTEYNGCYTIQVVTLTDGGKPIQWAHRHSTVPGQLNQ
jgi:hypothetical protein